MRTSSVVVLLLLLCTAGFGLPETATATYAYDSVDVRPVPLLVPNPAYPRPAASAGIGGTSTIEVLVAESGHVSEASVARPGGHYLLDSAALAAARRARFSPGWHSGRYVRVRCRLDYTFRAHNVRQTRVFLAGASVGRLPMCKVIEYPDLRAAGSSDCGVVATAAAVVDTSGRVLVADVVVHAGDENLANCVRDAALRSRFEPPTLAGVPCSVPVNLYYCGSLTMGRQLWFACVLPPE